MSSARSASRRELLACISLGLVGLQVGCSVRRVESPPPGPQLDSPLGAIPPDLQLTLRVALDRLTSSVATPTLQRLKEESQLTATLRDPLVLRALEKTGTVWTALRLGRAPQQTDNVLVLRGAFRDVVPSSTDWSMPRDLGAGWLSWQRKSKVERALPARVYARSDELLIFVSEAEIDAVERQLTRRGPPALEPPERGLVAVAASMPALAGLLRKEAPKAARLLADGTLLTGYADVRASGISVDLDFAFREAKRAEDAARAATLLADSLSETGGVMQQIVEHMSVEAVSRSVVVRVNLPLEVVGKLMAHGTPGGSA